MKIFVEMITYNGMPLLEAAIKSTLPYVDKIVVVDGSAYGPSTDDTAALIKSLPKVTYIAGTYQREDGRWDEAAQRRAALDTMERSENNWLLYQDADEVWDEENILRLISHLEAQPQEVCYCTYRWLNFWLTPHQTIRGGCFEVRRPDMVNRLAIVNRTPWSALRTDFPDVCFHHYSHAMPKSRCDWRVKEYFARGDYQRHIALGLLPDTELPADAWEKFKAWHDEHWYNNPIMPDIVIEPFTGKHHPEIVRLSKLIWGEQL